MGNRGILHNGDNKIVRPWAQHAWVTCLLEFNGLKRKKPFSPGNYSELFFIDEATALSAGHRPCAHCQRPRHREFKEAWIRANVAEELRTAMLMPQIDKLLHAERAIPGGGKRTFDAQLADLPYGAVFEHGGVAYLVAARGYLPWSFDGYASAANLDSAMVVRVLTPPSVISAFKAGFKPYLHPSAGE